MEFTEHRCRNCGGQLSQQEDKKWRCPYCSSVFEESSAEKHTEDMKKLFDESKQEMIANLRRNLYDATHAEYISSIDVHSACIAIKQYLPDDFQASFYEIAAGNNAKMLTKAIRRIDVEKNYDDVEGIVQFLIRSLQTEYLLELNNLVERAYKNKDLRKYEEYATKISIEADKVNLGVYETKYPREVFVAYSSKDMDKVSELVEVLEAQGMKCFVAARNLRHGKGAVENYNKALEEAMDHCRSFVFVSTPNSRSLNCDALSIELPYLQSKDIENAPAEYRNNYAAIPAQFKKPRVEYRIGDMTGNNAADAITKEFFDGYEWVYSPDEVAQRIMKQLIATPHAQSTQVKYVDMDQKKICVACGSENNVNTKFCGECGGNNFVNSVSEFIKLKKMQDEAEKAKNEAAIAEAEKAAKEALAEAEKAKKDAEAKAAKAAAAEKAKKDAEAKAKAAEEAKKAEALKNAGTTSTYSSSTYSSSSSSSSSSPYSSYNSYSAKPKKKMSLGLIVFLALVGVSLLLTITGAIMGQSGVFETDEVIDHVNVDNIDGEELGGDAAEYPYLNFTSASGGYAVSVNAKNKDSVPAELVIPDEINGKKIVEIAENAFKGCTQIKTVVVPNSVKKIGAGAFNACSSIQEIELPFVGNSDSAVESGGLFGYIFGTEYYDGGLSTKQLYSSGYNCERYYYFPPKLTKVTITNSTNLHFGAFYNCSFLTEINLNDNITSAGDYAFFNCNAITSISLPGLDKINDNLFYNCTSLESFEFGENVTEIGSYSFRNCTSLGKLNSDTDGVFIVPNNITSIGKGAFSGCAKLSDITIPFVGKSVKATGSEALFGYIFGTEYTDFSGTKQLYSNGYGSEVYYYIEPDLRKVTVTNAKALEFGAFYGCNMLTEINLNPEIASIGEKAFFECSSIETVDLPSITVVSASAFSGCTGMTRFYINDSVTKICANAFKGCTSLSMLNSDMEGLFIINNNVTTIESGAFNKCSAMKKIIIPFTGKSKNATGSEGLFGYIFGSDYYDGATSVEQVYSDGYDCESLFYLSPKLTAVEITDATSLPFGAFYNCNMLEEIILNDGITEIDDCVFYGCSGIKSISLPSITKISSRAFVNCTSLESFEIGGSVASIEDSAFKGCSALLRINSSVDGEFVIPDHVTSIGLGAFNACTSVKYISVPFVGNKAGATEHKALFGYIFGTDYNTSSDFTKQLYSTGYDCHENYYIPKSLKEVTVSQAKSLAFGAFYNCTKLEKITVKHEGDSIPVDGDAFTGCSADVVYESNQ